MATKIYTTKWTIANWANRASANHVALNNTVSGKTCDAYGRLSGSPSFGRDNFPRRAALLEDDSDNGLTYIAYEESANPVVIFKITKD